MTIASVPTEMSLKEQEVIKELVKSGYELDHYTDKAFCFINTFDRTVYIQRKLAQKLGRTLLYSLDY